MKFNGQPACDDNAYHPDQWFPDGSERHNKIDKQEERRQLLNAIEALEVCALCPIRQECLDFSFLAPDTVNYGIYGGTLAYERRVAVGNSADGTHGYAYQRRIRQAANSKRIAVPTIGKRRAGATWLKDQPELNTEFITRGMKLAQEKPSRE